MSSHSFVLFNVRLEKHAPRIRFKTNKSNCQDRYRKLLLTDDWWQRRKNFLSCPSAFLALQVHWAISCFGERFRDGQYSFVSYLFAVLLLTVPPCVAIYKSGGTCPPCPHWVDAAVCIVVFRGLRRLKRLWMMWVVSRRTLRAWPLTLGVSWKWKRTTTMKKKVVVVSQLRPLSPESSTSCSKFWLRCATDSSPTSRSVRAWHEKARNFWLCKDVSSRVWRSGTIEPRFLETSAAKLVWPALNVNWKKFLSWFVIINFNFRDIFSRPAF